MARTTVTPATLYTVRCIRLGRSAWLAFNGGEHYFWTRNEQSAHEFDSLAEATFAANEMRPDDDTPVHVEEVPPIATKADADDFDAWVGDMAQQYGGSALGPLGEDAL